MTTRQNFTVREGETFSYVFTYRDSAGSAIDLTGYTGIFKIAGFGQGTVALGGVAGTVTLSLTAAQTVAMVENGLTGFGAYADAIWGSEGLLDPLERAYTVYLTSGSNVVTRVLEGVFNILADVDI